MRRITSFNAIDRFFTRSETVRLDRAVPITRFNGSGNKLSTKGPLQFIDNLAANIHLTELDLSKCGLGDTAAIAIARMLEVRTCCPQYTHE